MCQIPLGSNPELGLCGYSAASQFLSFKEQHFQLLGGTEYAKQALSQTVQIGTSVTQTVWKLVTKDEPTTRRVLDNQPRNAKEHNGKREDTRVCACRGRQRHQQEDDLLLSELGFRQTLPLRRHPSIFTSHGATSRNRLPFLCNKVTVCVCVCVCVYVWVCAWLF